MAHPLMDTGSFPAVSTDGFAPVRRQSLSTTLARRIRRSIAGGVYAAGERLPSIADMARGFRVSSPTVREALKMLEATAIVEIRPGLGVFVARAK